MTGGGVAIAVRFPFGRYAATPWFRSRREHVDNVEWPPSPWRLARALVAVAERHGDAAYVGRVVELTRLLARRLPEYALPDSAPLTYTQWMPALDFGDRLESAERLDNGHYLLDLDPDAALGVRWRGVDLGAAEERLLGEVLEHLPFLGQSVAVAEARVDGARLFDDPLRLATAVDAATGEPRGRRIRLLAPDPEVTHEQLAVDTGVGLLKSMQAPPGSHWVTYGLPERRQPRARLKLPAVTRLWMRLEGPLRPPVRRLLDPDVADERTVTPQRLGRALRQAWELSSDVRLAAFAVDEDGDGRAELLELTAGDGRVLSESLVRAIADRTGIERDPIAVTVRDESRRAIARLELRSWIEHVERGEQEPGAATPAAAGGVRDPRPLLWTLPDERAPALGMVLPLAEDVHTAILSRAARQFGTHAIPPVLSGRGPDGRPLRSVDQHAHKHVLAASDDGAAGAGSPITHLAVWAPAGFSADERRAVEAIRIRRRGAVLELRESDEHPSFGSSRRWRSLTPYVPFNHVKPRGRNSVAGQIERELVEFRGKPAPSEIEVNAHSSGGFRLLRRRDDRRRPLAFDVSLAFAGRVSGPIALGRHAHFSLGLFVPAS